MTNLIRCDYCGKEVKEPPVITSPFGGINHFELKALGSRVYNPADPWHKYDWQLCSWECVANHAKLNASIETTRRNYPQDEELLHSLEDDLIRRAGYTPPKHNAWAVWWADAKADLYSTRSWSRFDDECATRKEAEALLERYKQTNPKLHLRVGGRSN